MNYQDQTANSIRIFLIDGEPNIEQFTVLKEDSFEWNSITVGFGILGESHFITFAKNNLQFSEICACTEAVFDSDKSAVVDSGFLSELSDLPLMHTLDTFSYSFDFTCVDYNDVKKELEEIQSVKSNNSVRCLEYHFPGRTFFHKKAITGVYIKETADSLIIRTIHTYPNEKLAICTNSSLKLLS